MHFRLLHLMLLGIFYLLNLVCFVIDKYSPRLQVTKVNLMSFFCFELMKVLCRIALIVGNKTEVYRYKIDYSFE